MVVILPLALLVVVLFRSYTFGPLPCPSYKVILVLFTAFALLLVLALPAIVLVPLMVLFHVLVLSVHPTAESSVQGFSKNSAVCVIQRSLTKNQKPFLVCGTNR